jgi:GDP-6-deoxy-D-talose 4-dehydrogenase
MSGGTKLALHSDRVLITGGTGFTGRPLAERLRRDGCEVVALGRRSIDTLGFDVDMRDFDSVTWALSKLQPSAIVHLAGIATVTHDSVGEIYSANVVGTANLFAALAATKIKPRIVIVASSGQLYAAAHYNNEPLAEHAPIAPKSHYAVSKHAVEQIASIYADRIPIIVARAFNYTGPGQMANFLVPKIVQHYAEGLSEIRLGNLDLFRDFSDIDRVVEAYARLVSQPIDPTIVNICSGRALYLADIVKIMNEISGHSPRLVMDSALRRTGEPPSIVGSPVRLEKLVGVLPNPEFRETLMRMYAFCKERRRTATLLR